MRIVSAVGSESRLQAAKPDEQYQSTISPWPSSARATGLKAGLHARADLDLALSRFNAITGVAVYPAREYSFPVLHRLTLLFVRSRWLAELGNPAEAGAEIDQVSPRHQEHPDVLEVRWEIRAATRSWDAAFEAADRLVRHAPERHSGWLHRAYALRRASMGGLRQAYEALRPAFETIPQSGHHSL